MKQYLVLISILILGFSFFSCKEKDQESVISKKIEVSDNEIINYVEYCNSRFDICIYYPSNFAPQPEPINGDGRVFINQPDDAKIIVFGILDSENKGIEPFLELIKSNLKNPNVNKTKNGYHIFGIKKSSNYIHHEIIVLKENNEDGKSNEIHDLIFTYPTSKKNKFKRYWKQISQEFT